MNLKSKSKILLIASLWLSSIAAVTFTACSDSDSDEPGIVDQATGVTNPSWTDQVELSESGEAVTITFKASGDWNIINQSNWLKLSANSGKAGNVTLTASATTNDTGAERSTIVVIRVNGVEKPCTVKFVQGIDTSKPTGVNAWIRDYMESHYLWNEPVAGLQISPSLSAEKYLTAILDGVDAKDHLNREDGHWANGKREYYYSYIEASDGRSRAGAQAYGSGIMDMGATLLSSNGTDVGLIVLLVCPDSPAAKLGMTRGSLVTAIGGTKITTSNYASMANQLYNGGVNVTWDKVTFDDEGYVVRHAQGSAQLASATFNDVSVYMSKVIELNSGKKVGYLLHTGFDYNYDNQLINAFTRYKQEGITDLIIDLRYNGGGHVISSLLMGTLVAGNQHKGKIYGRSTYNATRSQTTSPGEYKLGVATTPEMPTGYSRITEALNCCADLENIYIICSENTASASELVINGLRGVDVTVNLIGTTTNGKNCGMEGIVKSFGGVEYEFYPITFYIENAKGFKDYADGFTPDVDYDDSEGYPGDFGTTDDLYTLLSLYWINTGTKPTLSQAASRAAAAKAHRLPMQKSPVAERRIKGSIMLPHE